MIILISDINNYEKGDDVLDDKKKVPIFFHWIYKYDDEVYICKKGNKISLEIRKKCSVEYYRVRD